MCVRLRGDTEHPKAPCKHCKGWKCSSRCGVSSGARGVSSHPNPSEGSAGRPNGASPAVQPWYRILPEGGGLELI